LRGGEGVSERRVLIAGCLVQKGKEWTRYVGKLLKDGRLYVILKDFNGQEIAVPKSDVEWKDDRFICQPQDNTELTAV